MLKNYRLFLQKPSRNWAVPSLSRSGRSYGYGYAACSNEDCHRQARVYLLSRFYRSRRAHYTPGERSKGIGEGALMGADGIFSPDFYKAAGETAIGMYHSSPDFSAFGEGYKTFLEKHQKKYGEKPIAPFHAHAYDAAMMIFAAIEKVAKKAPDGTLYDRPKGFKGCPLCDQEFKGLTGNLPVTNMATVLTRESPSIKRAPKISKSWRCRINPSGSLIKFNADQPGS